MAGLEGNSPNGVAGAVKSPWSRPAAPAAMPKIPDVIPSMPKVEAPNVAAAAMPKIETPNVQLASQLESNLGNTNQALRSAAEFQGPGLGPNPLDKLVNSSGSMPLSEFARRQNMSNAPTAEGQSMGAASVMPEASGAAQTEQATPTAQTPEAQSAAATPPKTAENKAAQPDQPRTEYNPDKPSPEQADKTTRANELSEKIKNGKASADEIKEYRGMKQDPEQRKQELQKKALDGSITDDEAQELGNLNSNAEQSQKTPEQQAEEVAQKIEDLGADLMQKLAKGEEISPEDLEKFRNLRGEQDLMNLGLSQSEAKAAISSAFSKDSKYNRERVSNTLNEVRDKIKELMAIEMHILSIPKTIDTYRENKADLKGKAETMHKEANKADGDERLKLKGQEYGLYLQMNQVNAEIIRSKHMVPILEAQRYDLEQYVRRKVGMTGGLGALVQWAGAKANLAGIYTRVEASEQIDATLGVDASLLA